MPSISAESFQSDVLPPIHVECDVEQVVVKDDKLYIKIDGREWKVQLKVDGKNENLNSPEMRYTIEEYVQKVYVFVKQNNSNVTSFKVIGTLDRSETSNPIKTVFEKVEINSNKSNSIALSSYLQTMAAKTQRVAQSALTPSLDDQSSFKTPNPRNLSFNSSQPSRRFDLLQNTYKNSSSVLASAIHPNSNTAKIDLIRYL